MITERGGTTHQTISAAPLTGAAARREQARSEMRQAILAEARRLLTEEGANALSMRAIARALGYSPAALYEYFPAKEDIFAALYFEGADGLAGRMSAAIAALPPDATAYATLGALGAAYRDFAHTQPELFRLVFGGQGAPHGQEVDPDGPRPGFDQLVDSIARGIAAGAIVDLPPTALAITCWSTVHGFTVLEMNGFIPADQSDDLYALILDRILYGILNRDEGESRSRGVEESRS